MTSLVERMQAALPAMLADLETLVTCESPSSDLAAVARSADVVAELGAGLLGSAPEYVVVDGRTHLRWRLGDGPSRVLVLGHHDTVWPIGSLATHPFVIADGVLRGPGCFDMKTGLVMAFHALAALPSSSGVTLLVTGDEELGSPSSRALIEEEAAGCVAALVLEASADGALKLERKGVSNYEIQIVGRASHAGLEPEFGVNASIEAAQQILAVSQLGDPSLGTTVTPTYLKSGTTRNTVPAAATFFVDARARDIAEQLRVDEALQALKPVLAEASLEILGGPNRPPLERKMSEALYLRASGLAADLGLKPLREISVGGGSDGNFTAGIGTPTLDGLGADGGGAHADDEHVVVAEIAPRTALLTALIADLLEST